MSDAPGPPPSPSPSPQPQGLLSAAARQDWRLFDSLAEGVWERDLRTGEAWYSPRYKALLGFADDELPNLPSAMRERVHPDDVAGVVATYEEAMRHLDARVAQARIRTKDGQWRWFRGRVRAWPDAEGRAAILVGALFDVHDQLLATEALEAQQAVLEQRVRERTQGLEAALALADEQRMAAEQANQAKAAFLAHMSHELRTPLNGVLGMNQLALALTRSAEQRRYLELAQQSGRALLGIVDDVLDFARAEAGRLQLRENTVDIAALAAETLRGFMPELQRKGLEVGFDYIGPVTHVRTDAGRVRQIISNLVGNAIKFTDAGQIVLIVEIEGEPPGPCLVRLRVRDTGIGMDPATAARVFEPFEQGDSGIDRRHGGTGLGLAIVRMLARMMGGDVSVRSRLGRGSEFRAEMRLSAPFEQPLQQLAAVAAAPIHVWVLARGAERGRRIAERIQRLGWSADLFADTPAATGRLLAPGSARAPDAVVIAEDALTPGTDLRALCAALAPGVPVTLLLRPEFDLDALAIPAPDGQVRVSIAPLTPADLHGLRQRVGAGGAVPPVPAPLTLTGAAGTKPNVLVVEDNPLNQIIAREMVAALGLQPAVVASGEEAMLSCCSRAPDLVLMDIQMPGMDGLETTRRLRALQARGELPRFPIIALTAHAMASDREASLAAGMDEHLTKPVQLEQLRRVLCHWLAGSGAVGASARP